MTDRNNFDRKWLARDRFLQFFRLVSMLPVVNPNLIEVDYVNLKVNLIYKPLAELQDPITLGTPL